MIIKYHNEQGYNSIVGAEFWYWSDFDTEYLEPGWFRVGTMCESFFRIMDQSRPITPFEDAYYNLTESLTDRILYIRERTK